MGEETPRGTGDGSEEFGAHRPLLFAIAYRMLGSAMDAEDVVQEAYLRWREAAGSDAPIGSPRAWLSTVVTRLCIDHLRSARVRREQYVGPWLPEPLVTEREPDVADAVALAESLSMAFLVVLESLTPVERAIFLLHDVFGYEYAEIAGIVGRSEANCRQLSRRARVSVAERRPRFTPARAERQRLAEAFMRACAEGDLPGLVATLAEDVTAWSDGGGKVRAALRPITGADKVARFLLGILRNAPPDLVAVPATINGEAGAIAYSGGQVIDVIVLEIAGGAIRGIRIVANPDKLKAIPIPSAGTSA